MLGDAVPIDVAVLRENEDHRMPVFGKICRAMCRLWAYVRIVSFVQRGDGFVRGLAVIIFGFVIEKGHLKMALVRSFLQEREVVIGKGESGSVPVDHKG